MLDHHDLISTEVHDGWPCIAFGRFPPDTRKAASVDLPTLRYRRYGMADVGAPHPGRLADPEPSTPSFVHSVVGQTL